jgi:mRNA interferase RelE/StbE
LTSYRLVFRKRARKAWDRLDRTVRERMKRKLAERLSNPRVPAAALRDLRDCYKIKVASAGYRLIYRVEDDRLVLLVIAIGRRERGEAYELARAELERDA